MVTVQSSISFGFLWMISEFPIHEYNCTSSLFDGVGDYLLILIGLSLESTLFPGLSFPLERALSTFQAFFLSFVSLDSRVRYQHFVPYPLLLSYSVWGCHHLALRHLLFTFAGFASSVPPRTGFFCFADVLISFHFIAFLRWLSLVIAFLSGFFLFFTCFSFLLLL
jgi:hypothetical protein